MRSNDRCSIVSLDKLIRYLNKGYWFFCPSLQMFLFKEEDKYLTIDSNSITKEVSLTNNLILYFRESFVFPSKNNSIKERQKKTSPIRSYSKYKNKKELDSMTPKEVKELCIKAIKEYDVSSEGKYNKVNNENNKKYPHSRVLQKRMKLSFHDIFKELGIEETHFKNVFPDDLSLFNLVDEYIKDTKDKELRILNFNCWYVREITPFIIKKFKTWNNFKNKYHEFKNKSFPN